MKYQKHLFETIKAFRSIKSGKLLANNDSLAHIEIITNFEDDKREISFSHSTDEVFDLGYEDFRNTTVILGNNEYLIENLFIYSISPPNYKCDFQYCHTAGFEKTEKYFYNLVIPLSKEIRLHSYFFRDSFQNESYTSSNKVSAQINSSLIDACCIGDNNGDYFLILDANTPLEFIDFSKSAFALINTIAYVTGHLAGHVGYYFTYDSKEKEKPQHFYTVSLRSEIVSSYRPFTTNPYSYERDRKIAETYINKLKPLTQDQTTALASNIYINQKFEIALFLMLESSLASLIFMPGGFAIALETLTSLIIKESVRTKKQKPINPKAAETIRTELNEIVNKHLEEIDPEHLSSVRKRIEHINQPTNTTKLTEAFSILGIELSKKDLDVIGSRNSFLHGRLPKILTKSSDRSQRDINNDLYYASLRFYTLLNMLILKWIGYDGYVVNYPKQQEKYLSLDLNDEEIYRKI
jgi:hypothetical protein